MSSYKLGLVAGDEVAVADALDNGDHRAHGEEDEYDSEHAAAKEEARYEEDETLGALHEPDPALVTQPFQACACTQGQIQAWTVLGMMKKGCGFFSQRP